MDGGSRNFDDEFKLIFGVDGMVKYHNGKTEVPFFHHELFHVYHEQRGFKTPKIYTSLWSEGLATYVSSILNPGSDWKDLMLDLPADLVVKCEASRRHLLAELDPKLESETDEDYETYFLMESKHPTIPARAGYYLGYLVAKEINKTASLEAMVALKGQQLLNKIRSAMKTRKNTPNQNASD